jgi:NADH dehydrogenase FAD-containing subunit
MRRSTPIGTAWWSSGPGSAGCSRPGLKRAPVDITLVDRTPTHLFQPLLYQVATGILSPGEIAPSTARSCAASRTCTPCSAR